MKTCMDCGEEITLDDLGAKTCATVTERENNPFFVPIAVSEPVHTSQHLCGQCAKGKDVCPCCRGTLAPREEVANAISLNSIGRVAFDTEFRKKRNINGEFRCVLLLENDLYFSYILKGVPIESFWMKV